jgi:hypothetical protein
LVTRIATTETTQLGLGKSFTNYRATHSDSKQYGDLDPRFGLDAANGIGSAAECQRIQTLGLSVYRPTTREGRLEASKSRMQEHKALKQKDAAASASTDPPSSGKEKKKRQDQNQKQKQCGHSQHQQAPPLLGVTAAILLGMAASTEAETVRPFPAPMSALPLPSPLPTSAPPLPPLLRGEDADASNSSPPLPPPHLPSPSLPLLRLQDVLGPRACASILPDANFGSYASPSTISTPSASASLSAATGAANGETNSPVERGSSEEVLITHTLSQLHVADSADKVCLMCDGH